MNVIVPQRGHSVRSFIPDIFVTTDVAAWRNNNVAGASRLNVDPI